MGQPVKISRVLLMWEKARAGAYKFQGSSNGKIWTDVYTSDSPQGTYDAIQFASVTARWVRVLGEKRARTSAIRRMPWMSTEIRKDADEPP